MSKTAASSGEGDHFAKAFAGILREYGTSVPQISVVIVVIIGSLGFDNFFSAGAWTIVSVLVFAFVYLYHRQVSGNIVVASLFALAFFLSGLGGLLVYLHSRAAWEEFWQSHKVGFSAYTSIFLTTPLAVLLISYRKQESRQGLKFPGLIKVAIDNQSGVQPFYRTAVVYIVIPERLLDGVVLDTKLSYVVHNRTDLEQEWTGFFTSALRPSTLLAATFGSETIFVNDAAIKTSRGFEFKRMIKKGGQVKVEIHAKVQYNTIDSELFSTYHPSTDLLLKLRKVDNLEFGHEIYCSHSKHVGNPREERNFLVFSMDTGVLPYEGVRLNWKAVDKPIATQ